MILMEVYDGDNNWKEELLGAFIVPFTAGIMRGDEVQLLEASLSGGKLNLYVREKNCHWVGWGISTNGPVWRI